MVKRALKLLRLSKQGGLARRSSWRSHERRRGQTVVEYLMLLALTFLTGYLMATGPIANFAKLMITTIRSGIVNVVQNADLKLGQQVGPGESGHPSGLNRGKALHL